MAIWRFCHGEALCGFVNTDTAQGLVICGIHSDGSILGVEGGNLDKAQLSNVQHIRAKFDPILQVGLDMLELGEKNLVPLAAARLPGIALHEYDGRAWIREGTGALG